MGCRRVSALNAVRYSTLTYCQVYFNFKQHQISPGAYLPEWLVPLFLDHLPFEACARIWDVLLLEGDSFLYRASLGILAVLEPRLFFPERKELIELLKYDAFCQICLKQADVKPGVKIRPRLKSPSAKGGHCWVVNTKFTAWMRRVCGNVSKVWRSGGRRVLGRD